MLYCIICRWV